MLRRFCAASIHASGDYRFCHAVHETLNLGRWAENLDPVRRMQLTLAHLNKPAWGIIESDCGSS